jgi:hypothetical protein
MAPPAGADIEQPDCVPGGLGGPSSSHRARAGMGVPVGRGPLGHAQDDQEMFDPGGRFAPASFVVAIVGVCADGALADRPKRVGHVP